MDSIKFNQKLSQLKRELILSYRSQGYSLDESNELAIKKIFELSKTINTKNKDKVK